MNEKIEWYKEVLALEPHSRLFLPLAILYREAQEFDNALHVLKNGLKHHPEHLEARLLMAETLKDLKRPGEATAVVDPLIRTADQFPFFWKTWAENRAAIAAKSGHTDLAIGLRLTAAALDGQNIDWGGMLVNALLRTLPNQSPVAQTVAHPADCLGNQGETDFVILEDDDANTSAATSAAQGVRTRTMADLLAKQGDLAGALEIYEELWRQSGPGPERENMARVMNDLRTKIAKIFASRSAQQIRQGVGADHPPAGGSDKSRQPDNNFLTTLEALAHRLEQRAED